MFNHKKFFLFGISLMIIMTLLILLYSQSFQKEKKILHAQTVPITFEVTNQRIIGINAENDSLKFGTIMQGNFAERTFTIINPFDRTVEVDLSVNNEIKNITSISIQNFLLDKNERQKAIIRISPTIQTIIANHTGYIEVKIFEST